MDHNCFYAYVRILHQHERIYSIVYPFARRLPLVQPISPRLFKYNNAYIPITPVSPWSSRSTQDVTFVASAISCVDCPAESSRRGTWHRTWLRLPCTSVSPRMISSNRTTWSPVAAKVGTANLRPCLPTILIFLSGHLIPMVHGGYNSPDGDSARFSDVLALSCLSQPQHE